ncbi:Solute carrier family 35 member G1 [Holothuria leucospilota]|uniref:Solute carrier family 35 member G1 n=1 Tax=Holothuria leucospilota TaxID=206669 RepID=A0A9Q1BMC7_HOLLE|nr:Solute carrier family 35 member G1 [Holothuria leucospilota]
MDNLGFNSEQVETTTTSFTEEAKKDVQAKEKAEIEQGQTELTTSSHDGDRINSIVILKKFIPSRGMLIACLASLLFSCEDMCLELATEKVDPILVVALFTPLIFLASLTSVLFTRTPFPKSVKLYIYLGVCGGFFSVAVTMISLAISKIPVGDAVSILNSMPLFAGCFGWIFLKQSLRPIDGVFSVLCIVGVTLIARPSFIFRQSSHEDAESIGALYALISAVSFAVSFVVGRRLQDNGVHVFVLLTVNSSMTFVFNSALCTILNLWSVPNPPYYWAFTLGAGLFDFFAQISVFLALKIERAVLVTIVLTSEIIITFVMQILIVHIIPHWYSAIGAVCIIVACIGMATRTENEPNSPENEE